MATVFKVRFADGSGESFCVSVEEARRWVDRRANLDPTPPGILPAAIFELTDSPTFSERLVERYPHNWRWGSAVNSGALWGQRPLYR